MSESVETSPRLRQYTRSYTNLDNIVETDEEEFSLTRTPASTGSPKPGRFPLTPSPSFVSSTTAISPSVSVMLQGSSRRGSYSLDPEAICHQLDDESDAEVDAEAGSALWRYGEKEHSAWAGLGSLVLPLLIGVMLLITLCTLASQTVAHDRANVSYMGWGTGLDGKRHWRVRRLADVYPPEPRDRALRTRGDVQKYHSSQISQPAGRLLDLDDFVSVD